MKKILLAMMVLGSSLFAGNGGIGEVGSVRESFQVKIKLDLIKEDNSTVTVLDGTKFLELKTDGSETGLAGELEANQPAAGKYMGMKSTVTAFKHKIKIVSGGTAYYTRDKEVGYGESWDLSTNVDDYGYTTTSAPTGGFVTTVMFPKPLTITNGSDASLVLVNQYVPNSVSYETNGNIENSFWIDEITKASAVLPATPAMSVEFDINYTKNGSPDLTNTVTAFLDSEGDLIGGNQMRPENKALNGSSLTAGTKTGSEYTLRFQNGDDSDDGIYGDDYYDINVTVDCDNSTYSNLVIKEVRDGGTPVTAQPSYQDGYSLTTSGVASCTAITIP